MRLYSNVLRILSKIVIKLVSIKSMLNHDKKCISTWIDDLTLLQHWSSSKSHANCDLSAFSLTTSKSTSNLICLSSPHIHQIVFNLIFVFSYCVSASKINEALLKNSHETLEKKFEKVLEELLEKLFEKLLEKLNEKFTNCMHVSLKNWIYDKKYMLKTHATIKYAFKKCLYEIIVVEARFEERKIMLRFLFVNIWYHITWYRLKRLVNSSNLYHSF